MLGALTRFGVVIFGWEFALSSSEDALNFVSLMAKMNTKCYNVLQKKLKNSFCMTSFFLYNCLKRNFFWDILYKKNFIFVHSIALILYTRHDTITKNFTNVHSSNLLYYVFLKFIYFIP